MWFFASLQLHFGKRAKECGLKRHRSRCQISIVSKFLKLLVVSGIWLKPQNWNQGGYDVVFISRTIEKPFGNQNPKVVVKFVQLTRRCPFVQNWILLQLLKVLKDYFLIDEIEIFFLVKLLTCKIPDSQITGQGLLHEFGWQKCKENEKVRIIGVDGWKDPK